MIRGLYIHIPFCSIKCPYCDFTSIVLQNKEVHKRYIEALKKELLMYREETFDIETVYFGGGTPSLLEPELIAEFIHFLEENIQLSENLEITVEINPNTYRTDEFFLLREHSVNRVSIGAQSFLEKNLSVLGRDHKPEDILETVYSAKKAGIENINLDMIYGIQGQSLEDLKQDIKIYTSLPVTHISAYMLTAYEGTPLGQMVKYGTFQLPEEESIEQMYLTINREFEKKGFHRYEISNWAKENFICRHNYFYWNHTEFLGIGVSAWSFVKNVRFGNTKNLENYLKRIEKGEKPVLFKEYLTQFDIKKEKVVLGLRTKEGVEEQLIENKEKLKILLDENFLKKEGSKISLTEKGCLVSNYIINELI